MVKVIKLLDAVEDRSCSYCYVWMLWKTDPVNIILLWMLYSTDPVVNILYELFLLTLVRVNICSCLYLLLVVIGIFWLVLLTSLFTHHIVVQLDHSTVIYKLLSGEESSINWWVNYLLFNKNGDVLKHWAKLQCTCESGRPNCKHFFKTVLGSLLSKYNFVWLDLIPFRKNWLKVKSYLFAILNSIERIN